MTEPIAWRNAGTIEEVREFVAKHPDHRISLAWGQMLEDMDEFGDEYTVGDFQEEADHHLIKGHV